MAEPVAKPARRVPHDPRPPRAADFPGCREKTIPRDEIEDYEGRIEYWDARNEAAFIAEPTTTYHEYGARRLTRLVALIGMRRGAAITVVGSADLVVRDGQSHRRVIQADESVYLRTADAPEDRWIETGVHRLPDVVLEVDYSTDARRYKLGVYESWGFPEVWIEVPDAGWRYRPKNRGSALTIHLLEGGCYVEAPSSRAFPGWTAEEIHRALNETEPSAETVEIARRVADALAAAGGTSPDDDPLLRRERAEGREKGRAEGRADERLDIVRSAVQDAFTARSLAITPGLRSWLNEADPALVPVELIRLAWECRDADDFLSRAAAAPRARSGGGRGWTREELYGRGRARTD